MSTLPTGALRPFQPRRFGRFTLLAPLAAGGMGQIYLARARFAGGLEKICVIKKVLPELARDSGFASRFREEAHTLIQLQHGSIAQVYDSGEEAGEWWIALEFVDGKDLRRLLQRLRGRGRRMPLQVALYVAVKLLEALAYAHRKKDDSGAELALVHRDVSPQNVLLSYEGEVKVIDFGLARSTMSAPERDPSVVMGKFHYMAPEQARNLPLDRRADLYAVGVILYEAITGWNPFEEASSVEVVEWAATPRIPPVQRLAPEVPDSLADALGRALTVDPDERFASAEEMRARLGACLSELAPDVGPEQLAALLVREFADEHARERAWMASLNRGESMQPSPAAEETTRAASVPLRTPTGEGKQRDETARFGAALRPSTQRFDTAGRDRPPASVREEAAAAALAGVTTEPRAPPGAVVDVVPWDRDRSGGAAALRSAAAAASSVPRSLPWYESAASQGRRAALPAPEQTPRQPLRVGGPVGVEIQAGPAGGSGDAAARVDGDAPGRRGDEVRARYVGDTPARSDDQVRAREDGDTPARRGDEVRARYVGDTPARSDDQVRARDDGDAPAHRDDEVAARDGGSLAARDGGNAVARGDGAEPAPREAARMTRRAPARTKERSRRWPMLLSLGATALILIMWWQRTPVPELPVERIEPPVVEVPVEMEPVEVTAPEAAPAPAVIAAPEPAPAPTPRAEQPVSVPAAAPAPRPEPAPIVAATPAPRPDPRADLLAQRRQVMRKYEQLVGTHGADQVGGLLAGLVRATDSQFQRLIDDPKNHADLQRQLDELDRLLEERRRAFSK